jgi:hypothetical protein
LLVNVGDEAALFDHGCIKRGQRFKARQGGDARARFWITGQAMRLNVLEHLNAVLDLAKENVSAAESFPSVRRDRPSCRQRG